MTLNEARRQAAGLIADNQIDLEEALAELLMLREKRPPGAPPRAQNWTVTVPAWDSQQGYNVNGTPALTVERQAVALASCLQAGSHEDAANHCRELVKRLNATIAALGIETE